MSGDQNLNEAFKPILKWLKKHFNIHRFLWLLSAVVFFIAWNRGLDLLYGMLALIFGVLSLSYFYPFIFLRDIKISRKQRTIVKAGDSIKVEYKIESPKQLLHIELCEKLPFNNVEGGDIFKYFIPVINGEYTFQTTMPCNQRGLFELKNLSIESSYPFGIYSHNKSLTTDSASVLVLPKTFQIQSMPLAFNSMQAKGGNIESTVSGLHNEFSGLREYRYGDSMKHIHWASSAKHQELIVKEYESFDRPNILIVLNQHKNADIGKPPESVFEYAITICASIIEYAIAHQIAVHVFGKGKTDTCFSILPGIKDSREYLEMLALVQSDGDTGYDQVVNEAVTEFDDVNTVITFTNQTDGENHRSTSIDAGHTGHTACHIDLGMVAESFNYPLAKYEIQKAFRSGNRITWSVTPLTKLEELFVC